MSKPTIRRWGLPTLITLTAAGYPVVYLWAQNLRGLITYTEIVVPLLVYLCVGGLLFFTLAFLTKKPAQSALVVALILLVLSNYAYLETAVHLLLPRAYYWHVLPVTLFALAVGCVVLFKRLPDTMAAAALPFTAIVLGVLLVFNLLSIVPAAFARLSKNTSTDAGLASKPVSSESQRNVYFLIFDEYSGVDLLQNYYDYDNRDFLSALETRGFSVSYSSHNEYFYTQYIIANMLNLSYVFGPEETLEMIPGATDFSANSLVFDCFREEGYTLIGPGAAAYYNLPSPTTTSTTGAAVDGRRFGDLLIDNTPLYPFYYPSKAEQAELIRETFTYLQIPDHFSEGGPYFVFTHFTLPHGPFIFNRNGNAVATENYWNWGNPTYYLDQLLYANKLILLTVDSFIQNDPNALIILLSDHGARSASGGIVIDDEDKTNILAAVYNGTSSPLDIEGDSGINILRKVLNELFDYTYEPLPYRNYVQELREAT